jgi:hypothetical protein
VNYHQLKTVYLAQLNSLIKDKILSAQQLIDFTEESKTSATKGSAGDKHETARAMMERELALAKAQLNKAEFLQNELSKISLLHKCNKVEFGALIITSGAKYFMSIGLGKVSLHLDSALSKDSAFFYAISGGSPLGLVLLGKQKGHNINFHGSNIEIIDVV